MLHTHSSFVAWDVNDMLERHQHKYAQETAERANLSIVDIILGERHSIPRSRAQDRGYLWEGESAGLKDTVPLICDAAQPAEPFREYARYSGSGHRSNVLFVDDLGAQINGYTTKNNSKESMLNRYV